MWSLTTVTLLKDAAGQPQRFIGVIEDITQPQARRGGAAGGDAASSSCSTRPDRTLASKLDLQALVQAVTDAATQLSGAQFGAFFYNTTDENGDAFLLYTLVRRAAGGVREVRQAPRDRPVRPDVSRRSADPLRRRAEGSRATARWRPHHGMPEGHLPVRSYLAVPVRSRSGEVIGGLFFGHPQTGVFTERTERLIVGVAAQAGIAIDNARLYEAAQQAAEERKIAARKRARGAHRGRADERRQGRVPRDAVARAPDAAERHPRLVAGPARPARRTRPTIVRGLETIERNARVQTQLIEDLLDMSRITSGKLRLDIQTVHPVAFIEAAVETVRPAADAKGIRLESDARSGGRADLRRSGPAAAGRLEPAVQRHQVHAEGRQGPDPARARELAHRDQRGGHGRRHQAGVHSASVRTVPAGRRVDDAQVRRPRPRAVDREEPRRAARRHRQGRERRRRPGDDRHRAPAADRGSPAARRRPNACIRRRQARAPPTSSPRSSPGSRCSSWTIRPTRAI